MYVILLYGNNAESTLFKKNFRFFVKTVAGIYHSTWREKALAADPNLKNRFKLTNAITFYNSSDFLYPMILKVGSCLVHRNLKVARDRYNSSLIYVDILNTKYDELPPDLAYDNRATARIAGKYILQGVRRKRLFNQYYIEEISEIIHIEWMKRNRNRSKEELMVPYANLTNTEKNKDRRAVLIAGHVFNEFYFYYRFNTTPVYFIEHII
ncbi:unnamed protein product [Rotaria sordida]|uniref:Uncharacterized protein n=1 Tax=Rotaria sordida TaxID=392033 RepID=A0A814NNC1_9BILA|nr:unnamed protein product [Rotaria sordida]CAF1093784.1 unnamed protein product [Rotaria sordida]CAF1199616.1 unnamed protein product [Rotaria sordida]CAF1209808.1 unnamed protein product [Rotaria sordida]CAF1214987.1 unnamed protein product [Rotaria sordida]